MKYFELAITLVCWLLAFFWVKNSVSGEFPYEPLLAFLGGTGVLVDAGRRFGLFSSVSIVTRNSLITPWSFSGGKVEKTNISIEIVITNDKNVDISIRAVDLTASASVINSIGEAAGRIRLVDIENGNIDVWLPIHISAKSSKTIFVEATHDASSFEKYDQASHIGKLNSIEVFSLEIKYMQGAMEKLFHSAVTVNTSSLLSTVRQKYEESDDHTGVMRIIEKT